MVRKHLPHTGMYTIKQLEKRIGTICGGALAFITERHGGNVDKAWLGVKNWDWVLWVAYRTCGAWWRPTSQGYVELILDLRRELHVTRYISGVLDNAGRPINPYTVASVLKKRTAGTMSMKSVISRLETYFDKLRLIPRQPGVEGLGLRMEIRLMNALLHVLRTWNKDVPRTTNTLIILVMETAYHIAGRPGVPAALERMRGVTAALGPIYKCRRAPEHKQGPPKARYVL